MGNSDPIGGLNINLLPSSIKIESFEGLKLSLPAIANAVTISGLATKDSVAAFPSFLFAKFLLNDVMIVFFSPSLTPDLFHCPIHGPQALASTLPPSF